MSYLSYDTVYMRISVACARKPKSQPSAEDRLRVCQDVFEFNKVRDAVDLSETLHCVS